MVGIGEYSVVWLGTDWDREVQKSKERILFDAKPRVTALLVQTLNDDTDV